MTTNLLKTYRQDLHKIPELAFKEYKTKEYIRNILIQYDCELTELCNTAICAFFKSKKSHGDPATSDDETIAFRSDMDALPAKESTNAPYASKHEGIMHACGHDGHMAMLLGLAGEINKNLENLPYNVLLIFQPAEESEGGASCICQSGILERYKVKRIFGFHLWPMLEKGFIGSRPNEYMAKSSELDLLIFGKSAHCAYAEDGIDALLIGCRLIDDLYQMMKKEISASSYSLLQFGKMSSGTVRNTISSYTEIQGTLRSFHKDTFDFILKRIKEIASDYEKKYLCTIKIRLSEGYPPVINDSELFREAKVALSDFDFHTFENPFMLSEDFSFYQQKVPGLFLFLGTGTGIPLHSNHFNFDEEILEIGLKAYMKLLYKI